MHKKHYAMQSFNSQQNYNLHKQKHTQTLHKYIHQPLHRATQKSSLRRNKNPKITRHFTANKHTT